VLEIDKECELRKSVAAESDSDNDEVIESNYLKNLLRFSV
jgi:hypothetical protein